MKHRHIIFSILTNGIILSSFVGCANSQPQETVAPISDGQFSDDLKKYLLEDDYSVEDVKNFTYDFSELSEDDQKFITDSFGKQNPSIKKIDLSFETTSLYQNMTGKYSIIYAYLTSGWTAIKGYPIETESWEFIARDKVPVTMIYDTLKTLHFEGFEDGTIGADTFSTTLGQSGRKTDLDMGKDSIDLVVSYDAGFANYKIAVKLQYEFKKGKWQLENSVIDDVTYWQVTYPDSSKPAEPKEEYIIGALSNSAQYNTYMMNLGYVEEKILTKTGEVSKSNTIDYNYVLIVKYKNFGKIEYNVTKQYIYENGGWKEGNLTVSLKDVDFSEMIDTWSSSNGDFITFKNTDKNILSGTYTHKYDNDSFITYNITAEIGIEMKDNNWQLTITKQGISAGTEVQEFVLLPFTMDFSTRTLACNGNIFKAEGDDPYSDNSSIDLEEKDPIMTTAPEEEEPETTTSSEDFDSGLSFFD